jgi:hypothetical protein
MPRFQAFGSKCGDAVDSLLTSKRARPKFNLYHHTPGGCVVGAALVAAPGNHKGCPYEVPGDLLFLSLDLTQWWNVQRRV